MRNLRSPINYIIRLEILHLLVRNKHRISGLVEILPLCKQTSTLKVFEVQTHSSLTSAADGPERSLSRLGGRPAGTHST
jgi:hypothetical protein